MRRKLKNMKNKGGHSTASPRSLIDEAMYLEHKAAAASFHGRESSVFSGWSWGSRSPGQAIFIRRHIAPPG